jgi:hypothetical protein
MDSVSHRAIGAVVFLAAVSAGLLMIPLHEGAHWVACSGLGGQGCAIFYDVAPGTVEPGWRRGVKTAAGPALDFLIMAIAAAAAWRYRSWAVPVALAVTAVLAFRPVALGSLFLWERVRNDTQIYSDETAVAVHMKLPPEIGAVGAALLALLCVCFIGRLSTLRSLASWAPAILIGGAIGVLTWMRALGPVLLPWK